MGDLTLPHAFTPRAPYQRRLMAYFDNGGKRGVYVWHRRAGKDLTAMHQTCKLANERVGVYWHFFPTFKQARKAIWEGFTKDGRKIIDAVFPPEIVRARNETEMRIELHNGSIWRLMGTDNVENVGAGPVGVVFSEFALCKPSAWDFVRPMLRENGGWAMFITTPRGNNHAKKLFDMAKKQPGWQWDLRTVYDTGLTYKSNDGRDRDLSPDEMMAEERAEGMAEALIAQEYLCDWTAALVGSVWGDLLRSEPEAWEHPADGVYTAWDLGVSDATAIWFFRLRETGAEFIDHYEATGKPLSHFVDVVDAKGYEYVRHLLPHDARARTLVTGSSVQEMASAHWQGCVEIVPALSLEDGIQAGRWLLQQSGTRFHARTAGDGLEALRHYHYEYDEDRKTLARTPLHDWSSHTADAFRYAALVVRALARRAAPKAPAPPARAPRPLSRVTLDELFAARGDGPKERA